MSKVAAGMEIHKRDKKLKEQLSSSNKSVKKSGNRLLILDDIHKHNFKSRIVPGSSFLSLMNVEKALKGLAKVHAVSWAFSHRTGKSMDKLWPLLSNQKYSSYISVMTHGFLQAISLE